GPLQRPGVVSEDLRNLPQVVRRRGADRPRSDRLQPQQPRLPAGEHPRSQPGRPPAMDDDDHPADRRPRHQRRHYPPDRPDLDRADRQRRSDDPHRRDRTVAGNEPFADARGATQHAERERRARSDRVLTVVRASEANRVTKLSRWSILYKETIVPASMTPAREFVLFQTELFSFEQPDDQVSHWWIGGDCAGWFYARLLPTPEVNRYCDLVMEDWGWTFGVLVDGVQVWVKLWEYFPIQKCWLIGLESKRRLFQRSTAEVLA